MGRGRAVRDRDPGGVQAAAIRAAVGLDEHAAQDLACRGARDLIDQPYRAGDGRLATGWTIEPAADWAWARIQPSTWAHLVGMRGWDPATFTERTVSSLLAELVHPGISSDQGSSGDGCLG